MVSLYWACMCRQVGDNVLVAWCIAQDVVQLGSHRSQSESLLSRVVDVTCEGGQLQLVGCRQSLHLSAGSVEVAEAQNNILWIFRFEVSHQEVKVEVAGFSSSGI